MTNDRLFESDVIEIGPRKKRRWLLVLIILIAALLFFGSRLVSVYVDALWFSELGFAPVYWYKFKMGALLFLVFFVVTFFALRLSFGILSRVLPQLRERPRIKLDSVADFRGVNVLAYIYRPAAWIVSAAVALMFAFSASQAWAEFALFFNAASADTVDPIFQRNAGFYLFLLPSIDRMAGWFLTVTLLATIAAAASAAYVWSLERARGFSTSSETRKQIVSAVSLFGSAFAVALAIRAYVDRFDLLHGQHDLFSGANYTDANVSLPGLNVVIVVCLLAAVALVVNVFTLKSVKLIGVAAGLVIVVWIVAVGIVPQSIYTFSVKPNELAKEAPYIEHNIKMTREAFAIDRFEERQFNPAPGLTVEQIKSNQAMLENIRLWDRSTLQKTLSQIQEIRTYYEFRSPDVDRYQVNGQYRQVMLAARELNAQQLPEQSRNWLNQHIIYTHGYGVTMSSVNEFTAEGLPHLLLKNMPVESEAPEIKVTRPEIYFGETTDMHVYVHTKPQGNTQPEFNYPAPGDIDSYNEYEGDAGIPVGGLFRKLAFAFYLGDGSNVLFSDYIGQESRLLMRRKVQARAEYIAPFLMYDPDPYIVVGADGRLSWLIDAFTYSDRYPFSTRYQVGNIGVNYIRNSVKVVVDAYSGAVTFYVFEPDDPIIKTYRSIFPSLFRPKEEMPPDLLAHVRYPSLLMKIQANAYTLYHMQNPQTFYNHEDLWAIPTDEPEVNTEAAPMQPYHVMMSLPGEQQQALEFVNILPFTPVGPDRNNMIGWMAALSDGDRYGQTVVFKFPKNITVSGPAQVRARANQDSQLSSQITLWNQQGSRVLRGSLLVIPIADSLLYIEPFYLQAQNSPLPELRQVALATQETLKAGPTFDTALRLLFPGLSTDREARTETQIASRLPADRTRPAPTEQSSQQTISEGDPLVRQARQLIADYERLSAEGKHREAGEKLDRLKQALEELARKSGSK